MTDAIAYRGSDADSNWVDADTGLAPHGIGDGFATTPVGARPSAATRLRQTSLQINLGTKAYA